MVFEPSNPVQSSLALIPSRLADLDGLVGADADQVAVLVASRIFRRLEVQVGDEIARASVGQPEVARHVMDAVRSKKPHRANHGSRRRRIERRSHSSAGTQAGLVPRRYPSTGRLQNDRLNLARILGALLAAVWAGEHGDMPAA